MDFDGKVVLVTGASRGIGAAAARAFAAAGARVVLAARSEGEIGALASEIGAKARAVVADVARAGDVARAVAEAEDAFGGLDILIGNAGIIEPVAHLADADPDDWGRLIDVNLKGVFYGMRAAVPVMEARGGGTIITISSGAAKNALEGWSAYCASKAGAAMLTRCLDKEYRARGIRAMGLSPGTVATEMQRVIRRTGINPVSQLDWSDHIPADWPARALLWMAGPAGDDWLGAEVSLRDESVRRAVGLIE
ncbi:MAG: SDR family oxidoreductase [Paracoccaceae bacterium]|nr:SDR family oxidoreductase [Paracoccaceae bacterium]